MPFAAVASPPGGAPAERPCQRSSTAKPAHCGAYAALVPWRNASAPPAPCSCRLLDHRDRPMRAFGGADAATLADGQIDVEPCGPLHHALHGAVKPALRALDAFGSIDHGPHAAPVAGEHGAGPGRDRTQVV